MWDYSKGIPHPMLYKVVKTHGIYGILLDGFFTPFIDQSYDYEHISLIDSADMMVCPLEFIYGMPVDINGKIVIWSPEQESICRDMNMYPQPIYRTIAMTSDKYKRMVNDSNSAGRITQSIAQNFRSIEIFLVVMALLVFPFLFLYPLVNLVTSATCGFIYLLIRLGDRDNFRMNIYNNKRLFLAWGLFIVMSKSMDLGIIAVWHVILSIYGLIKISFRARNYKEEFASLYKSIRRYKIKL